ncbi:MAG: polysaccharide deacetylase family protein [Chitinivibrionales bacterium]|nr:polysaccharide deacetylase family protein [Chitinivibrionales bacterium]
MRVRPFGFWLITLVLSLIAARAKRPYRKIALLFAGLHLPVFFAGVGFLKLQFFTSAYIRNPAKKDCIALTFDDGPDPGTTEAILDLLKRYHAKATFFVIARKAQMYPHLVRRIFDAGHTVGNHDLTHDLCSNLRMTRAMSRDIRRASEIIAQIIDKTPRLYRPPVGLSNPHTGRVMANLDMLCIGWSRRAVEAGNRVSANISRIARLAAPGEVVLLHDTLPNSHVRDNFLHALESLMESIREQSLRCVGVEELFEIEPYRTIEPAG